MGIIIGVNVLLLVIIGYLHWRLIVAEKHLLIVMQLQQSANEAIIESAIHDKYLMFKIGHIDAKAFKKLILPMAKVNPQMVDWFIDIVDNTEKAELEQENNDG